VLCVDSYEQWTVVTSGSADSLLFYSAPAVWVAYRTLHRSTVTKQVKLCVGRYPGLRWVSELGLVGRITGEDADRLRRNQCRVAVTLEEVGLSSSLASQALPERHQHVGWTLP
jgi:hypothetical protein